MPVKVTSNVMRWSMGESKIRLRKNTRGIKSRDIGSQGDNISVKKLIQRVKVVCLWMKM